MKYQEKKIWPYSLVKKIRKGFSDDDLEFICSPKLFEYDRKVGFKFPRWMFWTSEHYSFGRCYRDWLGLPWWLPLPFYSDHGVNERAEFEPHEKTNKAKIHLLFNDDRVAANLNSEKKIIEVPHPWVVFKDSHGLNRNKSAAGTLIFYKKSIPGVEVVDYDFDLYFKSLEELPDKYKPFVLCMHMHDIRKGYHKKIRHYGVPIVSAGEASSPAFVERFYSLISNFKYATSNYGGSELFYCAEFGMEYFLYGEKPKRVNFSHPNLPKGELIPVETIEIKKNETKTRLFSEWPPNLSTEKKNFVSHTLGINVDRNKVRKKIKRLVLIEYALNFPIVIWYVALSIADNYIPHSILQKIRKIRNLLK